MNSHTARHLCLTVATATVVFCMLATPARCQTMSFSVYSEAAGDGDGVVFGTASAYDNSSGCYHGGYTLDVWINGPNGGYSSAQGSLSASLSLADGDGDYPMGVTLSLSCSCIQQYATMAGDSGTLKMRSYASYWKLYSGWNMQGHNWLPRTGYECFHKCAYPNVNTVISSVGPFPDPNQDKSALQRYGKQNEYKNGQGQVVVGTCVATQRFDALFDWTASNGTCFLTP
jgi:hypothetical protein